MLKRLKILSIGALAAATPAFAQSAPPAGGDLSSMLLMFGFMFLIMYFLLIRPQQQRAKKHQAMVEAIKRGDEVVTSGGLKGKVHKVRDNNEISVELAEGVRVIVIKSTVADVVPKGQPVAAND